MGCDKSTLQSERRDRMGLVCRAVVGCDKCTLQSGRSDRMGLVYRLWWVVTSLLLGGQHSVGIKASAS